MVVRGYRSLVHHLLAAVRAWGAFWVTSGGRPYRELLDRTHEYRAGDGPGPVTALRECTTEGRTVESGDRASTRAGTTVAQPGEATASRMGRADSDTKSPCTDTASWRSLDADPQRSGIHSHDGWPATATGTCRWSSRPQRDRVDRSCAGHPVSRDPPKASTPHDPAGERPRPIRPGGQLKAGRGPAHRQTRMRRLNPPSQQHRTEGLSRLRAATWGQDPPPTSSTPLLRPLPGAKATLPAWTQSRWTSGMLSHPAGRQRAGPARMAALIHRHGYSGRAPRNMLHGTQARGRGRPARSQVLPTHPSRSAARMLAASPPGRARPPPSRHPKARFLQPLLASADQPGQSWPRQGTILDRRRAPKTPLPKLRQPRSPKQSENSPGTVPRGQRNTVPPTPWASAPKTDAHLPGQHTCTASPPARQAPPPPIRS